VQRRYGLRHFHVNTVAAKRLNFGASVCAV
jgi:hypothetical protein